MKIAATMLLVLAGCVDDVVPAAELPSAGVAEALPTAPIAPDQARCLEIIRGLVPAPEIDRAIIPVEWGWSVAAGPWSRYNEDLAIVEDVFRYRGELGALTIHLHGGVVSCMFRAQIDE